MSRGVAKGERGIFALATRLREQAQSLPHFAAAPLEGELCRDLEKIAEAAVQILEQIGALAAPDAAQRFEVATARHDLRNPLNNIIGYSEMLLEDLEEGEDEGERGKLSGALQELYVLARLFLQEINKISELPLGSGAGDKGEDPAPNPSPAPRIRGSGAETAIEGGKPLVLVVDDLEMNREVLCRRLRRLGYLVMEAESGRRALAMLETEAFDLVLLDILMPELDGYEVLRRIKDNEHLRHLPVLMISAVGDIASVVRCLEAGADDYLTKPFNTALLQARIGSSLVKKRFYDQEFHYKQQIERHNALLEERVHNQVLEISRAQLAAIFSLSKLAESRDPETGDHLERIREYCRLLARYLQKLPPYRVLIDEPFIDNLYAASPLHDIGKVGIPDAVLLKPGRLTPEEFTVMQSHATIGAETLLAVDRQYPGIDLIRFGIEIAEGHHERWDGGGYPRGLAGEEIPLVARIVALADVYDALRSRRVYKEGMGHAEARKIIVEGKGLHFDPQMVEAFLSSEDQFQKIREQLGE